MAPARVPHFGEAVWYNGGLGKTERYAEVSEFHVTNEGTPDEGMHATLHIRDEDGQIHIEEDVPLRSAADGGDDPDTGGHTWRFADW